MPDSKVFVIGLDGATFDLIRPWAEAGELPVLGRLMSESAHGNLISTMQPMSAQAWTSFMTGKNIGKHGLVDFVMRRPGSYDTQIMNAKVREGKSLWQILSERGRRVAVLNVPMTFPAEAVEGVLVSGFDAPSLDSDFTWPREFGEELLKAVPGYTIEAGGHNYLYGRHPDLGRFAEEMLRVAQARFEATCYLMDRGPWDFLMTVFRPLDRAQHWFWKYMDSNHPLHKPGDERLADTILRVHKAIDGWVGALLERVDRDTIVILMSDHGFEPLGSRVVYLNTWLRDQGLLQFVARPDGGDGASSRSNLRQLATRRLVWPLYRELKRNAPTGLKRWLKRTFPQVERKVPSLLMLSDIDWPHTAAYAMEVRANVFINLKGREPEGTVEPGQEYEELRDTIIAKLHEWRDASDGEKVVERVYKREELFHGPRFERTPDLLIEFHRPNGYGYSLRPGILSKRGQAIEIVSDEELTKSLRPNAKHNLNGICLLHGPEIVAGTQLQSARIVDLAPTILYLLGEPVPDDMDGRVLTEALSEAALLSRPVDMVAAREVSGDADVVTYTDEDSRLVADRLRGLGYLD